MEKRWGKDRFERIFLLYLLKSRKLLLAEKEGLLGQLEGLLRDEIEKRNWKVDDTKRRAYLDAAVAFYEESLCDLEFLIERKKTHGSFNLSREELEDLYAIEKRHLGYSFEEESRNIGRDIHALMEESVAEDEAADFLLRKYATMTAWTFLSLEDRLIPNHLPDFVLAKAKRRIVDAYFEEHDRQERRG